MELQRDITIFKNCFSDQNPEDILDISFFYNTNPHHQQILLTFSNKEVSGVVALVATSTSHLSPSDCPSPLLDNSSLMSSCFRLCASGAAAHPGKQRMYHPAAQRMRIPLRKPKASRRLSRHVSGSWPCSWLVSYSFLSPPHSNHRGVLAVPWNTPSRASALTVSSA